MKKFILLLALCAAGAMSLPAEAQTPANTFARFRFSYGGTVFGDVEVELFDQDKPVTVSNFLHYVRSGAYKNTFIHRAYPAHPTVGGYPVIIQGGGFRLVNPFSTKLFSDCGFEEIAPTNSTASITNESNFGPIYTNGPGTLAMATQDGDPDSARASWFFNLTNNPAFNTNNGGYAVFGRVIKDPKKILKYFRGIQWADGIMYLPASEFYCGNIPRFTELPIAARPGYFCPAANLLFVVDITELNSTNRADTSRPTVTLTTPTANQRISNEVFTVTGKATDRGMGLAEVRVYPSPCDALIATNTTNWNLTLMGVPPGTNIIEVESVDTAGNHSAIIRQVLFRVLPTPVTLTNTGSGKITGLTIGQPVEIGRDYVLTAKADKGSLFAGWHVTLVTYTETNSTSITVTNESSSIRFRAQSNLTFSAIFVTNPFPLLKGTYVGLFYNNNSFVLRHDYSGAVKFTLTDQGKFSGSATFGSKAYPFSGTFHPSRGTASIQFKGPGGTNLVIDPVRLNLTNNQEAINGSIAYTASADLTIHWGASINAHRVHSGTTANPSPFTGSYTWMVPGEAEPTVKPSGDSFGKFTVSKTGTIAFSGTMADGTPVSAGGPIGTNGIWGLRAALYGGTGSILSWVTVDTNRINEDLFGTFYWFHPALPKAKFYTNAFTVTTNITGSRYIAPVGTTNRVLTNLVTDAVLALLDGNLPGPQTNLVMLLPNNTVTNQSTNKLTFTLTKTTGLFTGTVAPTNQIKSITYKGAILQKQGYGSGFHLDTNKSGRVYFGP